MLGEDLDINKLREQLRENIEISSIDFVHDMLLKKDFLKRYVKSGYFSEPNVMNELKITNKKLNEWCYRDKAFNLCYYYVKEKLLNLYAIYAMTSRSTLRYNYMTIVEAMFNNERAFHFSKLYHSYMGTRIAKEDAKLDESEKIKRENEVNIITNE